MGHYRPLRTLLRLVEPVTITVRTVPSNHASDLPEVLRYSQRRFPPVAGGVVVRSDIDRYDCPGNRLLLSFCFSALCVSRRFAKLPNWRFFIARVVASVVIPRGDLKECVIADRLFPQCVTVAKRITLINGTPGIELFLTRKAFLRRSSVANRSSYI